MVAPASAGLDSTAQIQAERPHASARLRSVVRRDAAGQERWYSRCGNDTRGDVPIVRLPCAAELGPPVEQGHRVDEQLVRAGVRVVVHPPHELRLKPFGRLASG